MTSTQEAPAATSAKVREFTLDVVVQQRNDAADGVVALDLADPDGDDLPSWEPGAHIDLMLEDGLIRQYSLCGNAQETQSWRVSVLLDPDSRGGSRHVHDKLLEGSTIRVRGPRNNFPLVDSPRYLFIAGGIGITPIIPMIESAQRSGSDWELVYLGRSRSTMAFAQSLADSYEDNVTVWPDDERGIFELEALLREPQEDTLIYCCGPEPLLAAAEDHSGDWPQGSLHIERFSAKPQTTESNNEALEEFQVICQRSAITVDVSADTTILEALEDADVPIMSSCLEGICGTCEATILEGTPDHRDSVLTDAERAEGNKLMTCVSRSCSEKLVLDL